jgi:hypothetical protein
LQTTLPGINYTLLIWKYQAGGVRFCANFPNLAADVGGKAAMEVDSDWFV